ncbi:HAMP domain-containing sensor histidine kinase [Lapillicoccus jejuensis]|uniref:Signal transduction histidine-protein kinase/phosphatase MprB n=1 Tax=Lapillicoccus jejuensis TaxID=402171 RepID=A0A542E6N9_9MICO|nr:HAMP domain-containing sensor histidine kinase [Lapillicoccus jejuensis]TQJ10998.1 two-component system sensor histidine kinase BaeS [Lapillicoccus jejuensis]
MSRRRGSRTSLATRIAALAVAVALLTSLVVGVISIRLLRVASEQTAQRSLAAIADEAQATATTGPSPSVGQNRARKALQSINVQIGVIRSSPDGTVSVGGDALARRALTTAQVRQVLDGRSFSLRLDRGEVGGVVYVEARPTDAGGLVLAQRRGDATALSEQALRQLTWSLLATALVAVVLALLVAWRLALPLRRTASAASALAEGHRDVAVPETGPREVAEVAGSVNRLAGALRHSEARQREFLLSVSHDLRTPLTAITGYAESLADGVVPPQRVPEVGAVLGTEAARLQRMVSDLLDLARLDAQEVSLHPVPLDLAAFAQEAAAVWAQRCEAQTVPFHLERTPGPLPVLADPQRLRQAVDGLLENALRVTPAGRPIVLAARPAAGAGGRAEAVVEVRDGGPGLTDEDLPVAFDRSVLFERYRGVRQVGTGLGLAIVDRIVTRLGGRVEAGHAAEGGARFTVTLPLADASPGSGVVRSDGVQPPTVTIG